MARTGVDLPRIICGWTEAAATTTRGGIRGKACSELAVPGRRFTAFAGGGSAEQRSACAAHADPLATLDDLAAADVLAAARAYAGRDDWGVENVSIRTLVELLDQLTAGVPAALIVEHATHTGRACCALARVQAQGER